MRGVAGTLANAFRTLFNLPEITAFLRRGSSEEPYWRLVLGYCVDGCLQSVLDEYAHVLRDLETGRGASPSEAARQVAEIMQEALMLHTASLRVDLPNTSDGRIDIDRMAMRARFAVRFGDERTTDESGTMRQEHVRRAFNSPFWPFVLASTSIGQEGLDFHPYCHAVVHWNLPGNPVDLEQREGRVHRYKGHAVRKNLARRDGLTKCRASQDPWQELFTRSSRAAGAGTRDLEPFWVCECKGGDRIQRHVLAQPLSRDAEHFDRLRRSLSVYRMAFGQPRQEDLLEYLMKHLGPEEAVQVAQRWTIDLSPRAR